MSQTLPLQKGALHGLEGTIATLETTAALLLSKWHCPSTIRLYGAEGECTVHYRYLGENIVISEKEGPSYHHRLCRGGGGKSENQTH